MATTTITSSGKKRTASGVRQVSPRPFHRSIGIQFSGFAHTETSTIGRAKKAAQGALKWPSIASSSFNSVSSEEETLDHVRFKNSTPPVTSQSFFQEQYPYGQTQKNFCKFKQR
jgi:hypothetical protein